MVKGAECDELAIVDDYGFHVEELVGFFVDFRAVAHEVAEEVGVEEGAVDGLVPDPGGDDLHFDAALLHGFYQQVFQLFHVLHVGLDDLDGELGLLDYVQDGLAHLLLVRRRLLQKDAYLGGLLLLVLVEAGVLLVVGEVYLVEDGVDFFWLYLVWVELGVAYQHVPEEISDFFGGVAFEDDIKVTELTIAIAHTRIHVGYVQ